MYYETTDEKQEHLEFRPGRKGCYFLLAKTESLVSEKEVSKASL